MKLEGESKSRLDGPKNQQDQDRRKTLLEIHKLLYKVLTVFPSSELRETGPYNTNRTAQYTLLRGQYEYPFQFKIPFNSDCISNTSLIKDLKVGHLSVQYGQEPLHAKLPLPPSLGGYPGEAEIKYYVKATVVRPKFYQENLRNEVPITFLPIEPPRPAKTDGETYGRRKHQFQRSDTGSSVRRKSLFQQSSTPATDAEPLAFQVDARLPNPAIITCRKPVPLRILVERLNSSPSSIFLSMLQIELIGHTDIRAHDLERKESGTWLLVSLANLKTPLEPPSNKSSTWTVPSHFWQNAPLPPTVAPTFRTCNMSRTYELEVRIGLSHSTAEGMRPETIMSPIKLEVEVYSGIEPPAQLLDAMAHTPQGQRPQERPSRLNSLPNLDSKQNGNSQQEQHAYTTSVSPTGPGFSQQHVPPVGIPHSGAQPGGMPGHGPHVPNDDLPPSYEDAIASDLAPVDGPRPSGYSASSLSPQVATFNPDTKSRIGRRVSERLFASNAPRAPRSSRSSKIAPGDMSHYGGDVVHEEPESLIESTNRLNIRDDEPGNRPPLPTRRTNERDQQQWQVTHPAASIGKKQAE